MAPMLTLPQMQSLETNIVPTEPSFFANRERMQQLVAELRKRLSRARDGGGAKYVERHREQGKLPVRERIDRLLDPSSAFLELSPLAATDMYDGDAPAAGLVSGIGRVSGREVVRRLSPGPGMVVGPLENHRRRLRSRPQMNSLSCDSHWRIGVIESGLSRQPR
jgi:hypothetical protein